MSPHLQSSDASPQFQLSQMCKRLGALYKNPHLVVDSAFCSIELIQEISRSGWRCTCAVKSTYYDWLWDLMSYCLPSNRNRFAVNSKLGLSASINTISNAREEKCYQHIFTTSFQPSGGEVTLENNHIDINHSVVNPLEIPSKIPIFTEENLKKNTLKQLKELCNQFNIKKGKKKAETVGNILSRVASQHANDSRHSDLITIFEQFFEHGESEIHKYYHDNFNLIDITDSFWSKVEEHHRNLYWEHKMLLALLRDLVINCWTFSRIEIDLQFHEWREVLISKCLKTKNEKQ